MIFLRQTIKIVNVAALTCCLLSVNANSLAPVLTEKVFTSTLSGQTRETVVEEFRIAQRFYSRHLLEWYIRENEPDGNQRDWLLAEIGELPTPKRVVIKTRPKQLGVWLNPILEDLAEDYYRYLSMDTSTPTSVTSFLDRFQTRLVGRLLGLTIKAGSNAARARKFCHAYTPIELIPLMQREGYFINDNPEQISPRVDEIITSTGKRIIEQPESTTLFVIALEGSYVRLLNKDASQHMQPAQSTDKKQPRYQYNGTIIFGPYTDHQLNLIECAQTGVDQSAYLLGTHFSIMPQELSTWNRFPLRSPPAAQCSITDINGADQAYLFHLIDRLALKQGTGRPSIHTEPSIYANLLTQDMCKQYDCPPNMEWVSRFRYLGSFYGLDYDLYLSPELMSFVESYAIKYYFENLLNVLEQKFPIAYGEQTTVPDFNALVTDELGKKIIDIVFDYRYSMNARIRRVNKEFAAIIGKTPQETRQFTNLVIADLYAKWEMRDFNKSYRRHLRYERTPKASPRPINGQPDDLANGMLRSH